MPRPATPRFETRNLRIWLAYPELSDPRIALGVVVFRDPGFANERRGWLRRAEEAVGEGIRTPVDRLVIPRQVHSAKVRTVEPGADREDPVCDGLVTSTPNLMVGVTVADCVPLLAFSSSSGVVGAAHCGWRGIAGGIVGAFVDTLRRAGGDEEAQESVRYLLGPSIGPCCYEVGPDLLSRFSERDREEQVTEVGGRFHFDLKGAVTARLRDRAVRPGQIYVDKTCTSCQQSFLSSYRAGGRDCGRLLAYAMLTG